MGTVHRARAEDGRIVAVKVLRPGSGERLGRFLREIRLLGELGFDQGFVPLFDSGLAPEGPYLVMPFLEGGTLRDRLRRGPLEIEEAVALFAALARTLGHAHARGIVHRDLKPENVLFSRGRAYVGDLGAAKHYHQDGATSPASLAFSSAGLFLGTMGYMAREQMQDASTVGPEADVFALGAMLYECLTGSLPYSGTTVIEILTRFEAGGVRPLKVLRPDAPRWLADVVLRCLASDPAARPRDGAALAAALEAGAASRRSTPRRGVVLAVLGAAIAVGAVRLASPRRTPEVPAPPPIAAPTVPTAPPSPVATDAAPELPVECRGFRSNGRTTIRHVLGEYGMRHAGAVRAVAPLDSTRSVSVGGDQVVRVWDTASGAPAGVFDSGAGEDGASLAVSSDGRHVAVGLRHGSVEVWRAGTPFVLVRVIKVAKAALIAVAFSEDAASLLTLNRGGELLLHDLRETDRAPVHVRRNVPAHAAVVAASGRCLVTCDPGGSLSRLDLSDTVPRRDLGQAGAEVRVLAGDRELRRVAMATADGAVHVRDAVTGAKLAEWRTPGVSFTSLAVAADGRVLGGDAAGTVHEWTIGEGEVATYTDAGAPIESVAFAGGRIAIAGAGTRVIRWTRGASGPLPRPGRGHTGSITGLVLAAGGEPISAGEDGSVRLWDPATGLEKRVLLAGWPPIRELAVSPDGRTILVGSERGLVEHRDVETGALLRGLGDDATGLTALTFSADGRLALRAGTDRVVSLLSLEDGSRQGRLEPHPDEITWMVAPPTSRLVVTTARDQKIRVFDLDAKEPRHETTRNIAYAFAPLANGRVLAANRTARVTIFDPVTFATVETYRPSGPPPSPTSCFASSPDGRVAVICAEDRALDIFDATTGRLLDRVDMASATDRPKRAAVAADGRTIYVGTKRGVVLQFGFARD